MAQKAIREYDAKKMLARHMEKFSEGRIKYQGRAVLVTADNSLDDQVADNSWLKSERLVVKPDQLFGKRGKNNLLAVNAGFEQAKAWIAARMNREARVHQAFSASGQPLDAGVKGTLTHFIVEPMIPHTALQECYLAFSGQREGDCIYFSPVGGIDVEENRDKIITIDVPTDTDGAGFDFATPLKGQFSGGEVSQLAEFIRVCFKFYRDLHFGFLEFNPLLVAQDQIMPLDVKARLDDAAGFLCNESWAITAFPEPFGHSPTPEEKYIAELDRKSGSSMKLTILNPQGRVWTMVAGGGASVIYTDTVVDLGFGDELANYGEYSGDPSTEETREYTKTILGLMTKEKAAGGKVLIIGGGIANFTDVSKTFDGVIQALTEYAPQIRQQDIRIYVRRAGPNYVVGLAKIRQAAQNLGLNMEVHGPELHMTGIVKKAIDSLAGGN